MRRVVVVVCTVGLLLAVLDRTGGAWAKGEQDGWSPPISLSGHDPRAAGWFPAMTADVYGHVHVIWNGRVAGRPAATAATAASRISESAGWLLYAFWNGQRWTSPRELVAVADEGTALRSSITSDPSGRLHMVYLGLDIRAPQFDLDKTEPIRYATVDARGGNQALSWSAGVQISRNFAYFPEIVADSRGVLHSLTSEIDPDRRYAAYYRRSEDGGRTWAAPVALNTNPAISRWRLQLKLGPYDDLHAVWEIIDPDDPSSRAPVGFAYARSTDGGHTWTTTTFAPEKREFTYPKTFEGTGWRVQPAVGVDGRGQIVLVWREFGTDVIYYQRSTDGRAWTQPARVAGVTRGVARPFDRYDMVTDSAGRIHLVMVGFPEGEPAMSLLHSEWLGYSWSEPEVVMRAATAPFPEWPRLAIGEGNRLHLVWFGGSAASTDRVPTGIWYSARTVAAPRIPAQPVLPPASNPSLFPRASGAATPEASPAPTAAASGRPAPLPVVTPDQLQPSPWPLATGLSATAALLATYLLGRRWWHTR